MTTPDKPPRKHMSYTRTLPDGQTIEYRTAAEACRAVSTTPGTLNKFVATGQYLPDGSRFAASPRPKTERRPVIVVALDPTDLEELRALATTADMGVATYVRTLIRTHLDVGAATTE